MRFISITLHSLFLRFVGSVFLSHIRLSRMYDGLSNLFSVQVFAITGDWRGFFMVIFFKVRFVSFLRLAGEMKLFLSAALITVPVFCSNESHAC
jgi:hypothetical protein